MRNIVVLVAALASLIFAVDSATKGLGNRIECFRTERAESRVYESKIKAAIMEAMEKLRNEGIPALNISSADPFVLDDLHIGTNQPMAQLNWNMTDGQIVGQTYFNITKLTLSLAGLKFTFGFHWPSIHGQGKFGLDGILGEVLPVYGHGDFDVEGKDLVIEGTGKLGSDANKFLFLENFNISISLKEFNAKFVGLMDDPKLSEMISDMVSQSLPVLMDEYHETISAVVNQKVIEMADQFLANKTIGDIIGGLGRDYIHCGDSRTQPIPQFLPIF